MKKITFIIVISLHASLFTLHSFSQPCLPEGITFTTQEEINNFQTNYPNCTEIEGDVLIIGWSGSDITNLDGLNVLTSIGGDLRIGITSINGMGWLECIGNPYLEDIVGLSNLTYIGGDLGIYCNDILTNLSGLENLSNIGGSLGIGYAQQDNWIGLQLAGNQSLTSITALAGITSVGGDIVIMGNVSLESISGLENIDANSIDNVRISYNSSLSTCEVQSICDFLLYPDGEVDIYNNAPGCNNPFEIASACGFQIPCLPHGNYHFKNQDDVDNFQVHYPGCADLLGSVIISENESSDIIDLSGLSVLNSIGGSLVIMGNESLATLSGMNGLHSIGGDLVIGSVWTDGNASLINLTGLDGLTTLGGDFQIKGNDSLNNIQSLENIHTETIQRLSITHNPFLSACAIQSVCDYLVSPNGYVNIDNNAPGCNSEEQVLALCGNNAYLPEGITFSSQEQINSFPVNYPACKIILGDVKIQGDDIENLYGLTGLISCWEDLRISNNPSLISLSGLDSLISIRGRLSIYNNDILTNFEGLNNLAAINEDLTIQSNDHLTSLSGLDELASLGENLSANNNYALTSIMGLNHLTSIGKSLTIRNNDALTSLNGLEMLASIGEDITIEDNNTLVSIAALENLNTIGDFLIIRNNDELTNLSGLDNIDASSIVNLGITDNESLSTCHVQSICNYLAAPSGTFGIGDNAPGCNNPEEVEEACAQSVDEVSVINNLSIHPNPFSNTITIEFELKQPETITINLYNHLGEQVEAIAERKSVGQQKIEWNAEGLPAGIYFCVLKTNKGMLTRKIIKL